MMLTIKASFDDGSMEDMWIADLMAKYEIKNVIFYIPSNWEMVNFYSDRESLVEEEVSVLAKTFEIGSHTVNHPMLTRIPLWQAEIEIIESKQQLEEKFGVPINSFCYPRGYANDEIRKIVRKHYKTARNTLVNSLEIPDDPIWETTTVHIAGKRRKEYEDSTWLDEAYILLDEAIERAKDGEDVQYHMWGHGHEISKYDGWYDFEQLLKEVHERTRS